MCEGHIESKRNLRRDHEVERLGLYIDCLLDTLKEQDMFVSVAGVLGVVHHCTK